MSNQLITCPVFLLVEKNRVIKCAVSFKQKKRIMTMNTEKRTARVFTPEQKFEILKDIEKQESVKSGAGKIPTFQFNL